MLGRKTFTQEELDHGREAARGQLAVYHALREATDAAAAPKVGAAVDDLEAVYFNASIVALDRRYVHRVRSVTGKDTNPLAEVEVLCDSLIDHGGVLTAGTVVRLVPEQSVLGLREGERIRLSASDFERLSDAFLSELERRCLEPS